MKLIPLIVGIVLPVALGGLVLFYKVWVDSTIDDRLKYLFSLLTLLGILIAVVSYLYNKEKDRKAEVTNQIKFFREEIIPLEDLFLKKVLEVKHVPTRLDITEKTMEAIILDGKKLSTVKLQRKISGQKCKETNQKLYANEIFVLNFLEEFSIRVKRYNTQSDTSLNVLHKIFVDAVECHATTLFYVREIEYGAPLYSHTLSLYFLWKNNLDKRTPKTRFDNSSAWKSIIN